MLPEEKSDKIPSCVVQSFLEKNGDWVGRLSALKTPHLSGSLKPETQYSQ
jgi:hypothetical protein